MTRRTIREVFTARPRQSNGPPANFRIVQLAGEELSLFNAACSDVENIHAQELMNVFGVSTAPDVLIHINHAPIGLFVDIVAHIWYAILHEAFRRDPHWGEVLERTMGC